MGMNIPLITLIGELSPENENEMTSPYFLSF